MKDGVANFTVKESLVVRAAPAVVWDYTQDWTRRAEGDPAITSAEIVQAEPSLIVNAVGSGGTSFAAHYKLSRRPEQTSLAMHDCKPAWLGGGGSWSYQPHDDGTLWTQTNTLKIDGWRGTLFGWFARWQLRHMTRKAMRNAKAAIEAGLT